MYYFIKSGVTPKQSSGNLSAAPNNQALKYDGFTNRHGLWIGGVYVVREECLTPLENNHWVRKLDGTWKEVHDVPHEDLDGLKVLDFRAGDKVQGGVFLGINEEGLAQVETPDEEVVEVDPLSLTAPTGFKVGDYVKVADEPLYYIVEGRKLELLYANELRGKIACVAGELDIEGDYGVELSSLFYYVNQRFLTPAPQTNNNGGQMFNEGDLVKVTPIDGQVENIYGPLLANWDQTFRVTNVPDSDGDIRMVGDDGTIVYVPSQYLAPVEPEQEWKPGDTAYLVEGELKASYGTSAADDWDRIKPIQVVKPVDSAGDVEIHYWNDSNRYTYVLPKYLSKSPVVTEPDADTWKEGDTAWLKDGTLTFYNGTRAIAETENWDRTKPVTVTGTVDEDVHIKRWDGERCYVAEKHLSRTQVVFAEPQWKIGDTAWLKPIGDKVRNSGGVGYANIWNFTQPVTISEGMDEDGDILIEATSGEEAMVLGEYLSRTQVVFPEPEPEPQVEDRLTRGIRETRLKLASLGEEQEALQETLAVLEKAQELLESN